MVGERLAGPGEAGDLDQLFRPRPALLPRDAERAKLVAPVAEAEAELQPSSAQLVDERGVLGEADRVVEGCEQDRGAEPDRRRLRGDRGQKREDRREISLVGHVVLRDLHRLEAGGLGPDDLSECLAVQLRVGLMPAWRVAEVVPDAEFHLM